MSDVVGIDEKYTLWKLLKEFKVVIPIIQRDYAQGRTSDNASAIRDELLDSIYNALTTAQPLDFDFVYGTVEDNTLYPLDGQQRLTTFYLLHWYLAQKEGRMEVAIPVLSNFTYETRVSSRKFCNMLMGVEYTPTEDALPSAFIKNENGYFRAWNTDPTISHMLTMLDAIHAKFFETEGLFDLLVSEDDPILTFNFLPMEHYALTDDLYIKMNARGKALTVFENFKAKFIQHMKELDLPYEHFENCIDGCWTDLLWDYRDVDNTVDDQFMNLFCYITEMLFLETSEPREGDSPFRTSKIRGLIDYYEEEKNVTDLYSYLDLWKDKDDAVLVLSEVFTNSNDDSKVKLFDGSPDLFSSIINGESVSLANKLLLFSVMKRLVVLGKDTNMDNLKDFVRVVRNFLLNTRMFIRKKCSFSPDLRYGRHAIPIMQNFINMLVDEDDPYDALVNLEFEGINSEILALEKGKAQIILDCPQKRKTIQGLEDLNLFKGSIFNVLPYVESNDDEFLVENMEILSQCDNARVIQALLSIKDYGIKIGSSAYGDRYFYGNIEDWYSIFTYNGGQEYTDFICTFIEQFENTESNKVEDALGELAEKNLPTISINDWRYTLVKYYRTIDRWKGLIDHPFLIFAKEECTDGSLRLHRINGFILNAWHVVPEYLEIKAQLGKLCTGEIRSYECDEDNEGAIYLSCVGGLSVQFDSDGTFSCEFRDEDAKWVNETIEKYHTIDIENMDRVETAVLLCRMLTEKSDEIYGASPLDSLDDNDDGYTADSDKITKDLPQDDYEVETSDSETSAAETTSYAVITDSIYNHSEQAETYKEFLKTLFGSDVVLPDNIDEIFVEQVNTITHAKARAVLWKLWKEGKSAKQIAKEMSITIQYVYSLRDRGMRMMRHPSRLRYFKEGLTKAQAVKTKRYDAQTPIDELNLSIKVYNSLKRAGINTVGDLDQRTQKELLQIHNFGKSALNSLIESLDEAGIELRNY